MDALDQIILWMNVAATLLMIVPTVMVVRTRDGDHPVHWFIEMMAGGAIWGLSSVLQVLQAVPPPAADGLRTLGWFLVLSGWVLFAIHFPRRLRWVERIRPWLLGAAVHLPLLIIGLLRVSTDTMFYMEEIGGRYVLQRGEHFYISLGFGYGYCVAALGKLYVDRIRSPDPEVQTQAALIFAAGLPTVLLNVVEIVFLPTRSAFTSVGFCVTGTLIGIGIVKYRMFGVTRVFQHGLAAALTSLLAGLLFKTFEEVTEGAFESFLPTELYLRPSIVAVVLVGVMFMPLHRMTGTLSHDLFPRRRYLDFRVALLRAAEVNVGQVEQMLRTVDDLRAAGSRVQARRLMEVAEAQTLLLEAHVSSEIPFQLEP